MRGCEHCGTENDDTRVFCANCGTRLPEPTPGGASSAPGSVPVEGSAGAAVPPLPPVPPRRTRIKPSLSSGADAGTWGGLLLNLFWIAALGALLAALIQMAREPDRIPPAVGADSAASKATFATLSELASSPTAASWTVNGKAINQFLETTIQMKPAAGGALTPSFQRAFISLRAGDFSLGIEQLFLGRHLYFVLDAVPTLTAGHLGAKATGGAIGRLPVHPLLVPLFLRLFEPTLGGLSQPAGFLTQAKSVTLTPDDATLEWPGTGAQKP